MNWKYKLGIYAVFAFGAVLYFVLAMHLASVEIERDALRETQSTRVEQIQEYLDQIRNLERQNNLLAETVETYADVAAEFYDMVYGDKKDSSKSPCRLYDSLVLIDGILYERAAGARTAWNNGVADEH